ncbi:transmembrane protein 214, partial [Manacus vitellinus]|uniref:transmembrane protein 214 n=1 Tax=Manacus vitellinus TaxID=328815 RepID=UPI00115F1171
SLEEALRALDLADLQKELEKSRSVFPENPSVWVKDLAGYLNYKLQAPQSDPVLSQHPHDYPYSLASKELRSIIRTLLGRASGVLELFFDHCIYTMLQELDKAPGEHRPGTAQGTLLSLPASSSARLLRSSGVLPASQLAWQKVSHGCLEGYRWLEHSLAHHGSAAVSVLRPQLELLWDTGGEVARDVSQQCYSLLSWLQGSLPWLSEWVQTRLPESLLHFGECVRELLLFLVWSCLVPLLQGLASALQQGWQRCLDSCNGDVTWECVRDHLTSFTYSSWIYLQNTTLALKNWALAMISGH